MRSGCISRTKSHNKHKRLKIAGCPVLVVEQTVNMPLADAYEDLKTHLKQEGCKIISETSPTELVVRQGSLWGLAPQNAKKFVTCTLSQNGSETKISCSSKLSRDWVNITVIGIVFSIVMVGVCVWISLDLAHFLDTGVTTTWSWIASSGKYIDYNGGEYFINLTHMLSGFLTAVILAETGILFYARYRVDLFIKEIMKPSKTGKTEKVAA
jgi:hypothetical protein